MPVDAVPSTPWLFCLRERCLSHYPCHPQWFTPFLPPPPISLVCRQMAAGSTPWLPSSNPLDIPAGTSSTFPPKSCEPTGSRLLPHLLSLHTNRQAGSFMREREIRLGGRKVMEGGREWEGESQGWQKGVVPAAGEEVVPQPMALRRSGTAPFPVCLSRSCVWSR